MTITGSAALSAKRNLGRGALLPRIARVGLDRFNHLQEPIGRHDVRVVERHHQRIRLQIQHDHIRVSRDVTDHTEGSWKVRPVAGKLVEEQLSARRRQQCIGPEGTVEPRQVVQGRHQSPR